MKDILSEKGFSVRNIAVFVGSLVHSLVQTLMILLYHIFSYREKYVLKE